MYIFSVEMGSQLEIWAAYPRRKFSKSPPGIFIYSPTLVLLNCFFNYGRVIIQHIIAVTNLSGGSQNFWPSDGGSLNFGVSDRGS